MPVNLKKDSMGSVIDDFYKSDAPQFKGKSKKKRREMAIAAKLSAESALYFQEQQRHWSKGYDSGDKTVPRRKALDRAEYFDNRGENERANKIRRIAISKDHGDDYEARKKAKNIKISDKIGKLRPASIDDKRGAVSGDVQKKLSSSYEPQGEVIDEKVGGSGTLVRQGVKYGGKKGGRAVQQGTTAATAAGKAEVAKAQQGNQSKMVGSGRAEKIGATAGMLAGGVAGAAIPDGPLMVAGELAGGYAGAKIGGKIGRQVDKAGSAVKKAVVGEGKLDRAMNIVRKYTKKKEERKPQKAMDAGARLRRKKQRQEYAAKVSGSEDLVPDNIRDHKIWDSVKSHI